MDEELKHKIILIIVEVIVVGGLAFFLNAQYKSLMSLDDIKFVKGDISCITENCSTFRQKIYLYRMGEKPLQNIDLHLAMDDPSFTILDGSQTVTQKERGFGGGGNVPTGGSRIFPEPEMSELTNCNYYGYRINELRSNWTYELTFDVESQIGRPQKKYAVFEINNGAGIKYEHQGLNFYDYLRLFLVEATVVAIFLSLAVGCTIWFLGRYLLARKKLGR